MTVSATTVRTWLRQTGVGPAGTRRGIAWREFIRTHRHSILAVDFFTVETIWLQRLYVLFFIELGSPRASRRMHAESERVMGHTASPATHMEVGRASGTVRFLIRDRDQKFADRFDDVFRGDRIEIIRTPFRAPQANGVAERFVRKVRSECLDWLLILNQSHLEHVLSVFVDHYNGYRPHRALGFQPPHPTRPPEELTNESNQVRVQRRDRLGGLIHEYSLVA